MVDFDVIPPVSDAERAGLERALVELRLAVDDTTATDAWWRAGVQEAVESADLAEPER